MLDDDALDALWTQVLARWDEASMHALFVEQCRGTGKLGYAARRYRDVATPGGTAYREDTARIEEAKKRLGTITTLAILDLEANRTPPVQQKVRSGLLATALVFLATVTAVIFYLFRSGR